MGRAPCCEKVGLKRGRWTTEEDEILTKYIQLNGEGSWRSLPKNAGLLRCGKSCRLRWINYLRSDLKRGNITAEEETLIIKLHATMGNRWSLIAGHLPGRTDNEIKNYWNSHLSRKIHTFTRRRQADGTPLPCTDGMMKKRRGGRTSRSAMKKTRDFRTRKLAGVLPNKSTPSETPKEANNKTSSSPVAIMPETPTIIDKENSMLSSAISWQEEDLESFFTDSYSIDDVLLLASNEDVECNKEDDEENRETITCFSGIMEVNDTEKMKLGALNSCFAESREVLDYSSETLLSFQDENLQSQEFVCEKKMDEGRTGAMELDNNFCTLSPSEFQENGQLGLWCPSSPVLTMMGTDNDDEGQIRNFDISESDNVDSAGGTEDSVLSWLWDTSPYEGKCYNQNGDELVDVEKQNAMVAWLLS